MLSTNLVFSEWTRIFKHPLTTVAAIDRVVHHSVILDLMGMPSYRAQAAKAAQQAAPAPTPPTAAEAPSDGPPTDWIDEITVPEGEALPR